MSIVVNQLSKRYGRQFAIQDLSFTINKGEVLGLLGPNGAGKTTTMKILACYQDQTSGTATVGGFDTRENPQAVKRITGYLSEHNPLYPEMYVREYLQFVSGMYQIKDKKARIDQVIGDTGLGPEVHKRIGQLSKGYKQRVGLAQVMIHDPEILILDEPISGLDPNQLVEIRSLIKSLGKEKTVIFSSHIMQEVQAICDRVIILNQGKIVLDVPISELDHVSEDRQILRVTFSRRINPNTLLKIDGIAYVEHTGDESYKIRSEPGLDIRETVYDYSVRQVVKILELHKESSSVEDVFQIFTKNQEY